MNTNNLPQRDWHTLPTNELHNLVNATIESRTNAEHNCNWSLTEQLDEFLDELYEEWDKRQAESETIRRNGGVRP